VGDRPSGFSCSPCGKYELKTLARGEEPEGGIPPDWAQDTADIVSLVPVLLAIINSPRIIGRHIHSPHKGLVRELRRAGGLGIGPLHDWHEIKLEVTKPRDIYDGEPHEDVITGRRALHFCRKHIRICHSGVLTYVREHWRGDPAIGIRQGRYHVTA
jgi:hypothetical protein